MARFSGLIQSAKFVDQNDKTIEILYGEDPTEVSRWILAVDYSNQDFLDFVEEMDLETVAEATYEFHQHGKSLYEQEIEAKASQMAVDIAQDMFDKWVANATTDIDKAYKEVDDYREKQEAQLQAEYAKVDAYKAEQLSVLQEEFDQQVKEVWADIDRATEARYKETDAYTEARYKETDAYKEEQVKILEQEYLSKQRELEQDIETQKIELEKTAEQISAELEYAETEKQRIALMEEKTKQREKRVKADQTKLLDKMKRGLGIERTSSVLTSEDFVKQLLRFNEDEDYLFKTKLVLFNENIIKTHPDREAKMNIKKSKSLLELFAAYQKACEIVDA